MHIEVYSDLVCPWCYVGQARLSAALKARAQWDIRVSWLPFELNPAMPIEGRNRREYMLERFGDLSRFDDAQRQLVALGSELGLQFHFDDIQRSPNTRRAHMLLQAAGPSLQHALVQRFFRAYFTEGKDIGDMAVLLSLAEEVGLPGEQAQAALTDQRLVNEVEQLERQAQSWRISGVPTFIFDRRIAFSGAQPLEVFLQAMDACSQPKDSAGSAGGQ